jgi:hypothetical protein
MDNIYGVKANLTSKKSTKNAQMKPPGPSGAGFSTLSLISTDTYTAPLVTGFSLRQASKIMANHLFAIQ